MKNRLAVAIPRALTSALALALLLPGCGGSSNSDAVA